MRFSAKKYLFIFALGLAAATAVWIEKNIRYFPTSLILTYDQTDSEALTVYFDTGNGFNEQERERVFFKENQNAVDIALPLIKLHDVRFDLDTNKHPEQSISINSICLKTSKRYCWQVSELIDQIQPLNSIASYGLIDEGLLISTRGADPHFSFKLDYAAVHSQLSEIPDYTYYIAFFSLLATFFVLLYCARMSVVPFLIEQFLDEKANGFRLSVGLYAGLVSLLAIFLSGSWLIAFKAGWLFCLVILLVILLIVFTPTTVVTGVPQFIRSRRELFNLSIKEYVEICIVTVLCLLPIIIFSLNTWVQEFPHLGDHEYHMWGNKISYQAIQQNYIVIATAMFLLLAGLLFGLLRWAILVTAILLLSTGVWNFFSGQLALDVQGIFARYPGGARFLAQPFIYFSYLTEWHSPLNTARIVNMLSVPVWLLILRPLIIGRLPNLAILPLAIVLFWQAELLYLFTTAYLDVWCAIFVLLALEKLLVDQSQDGYLKACLLLSVACAFKEPAVFIIPWFWLAGWSLGKIKTQWNDRQLFLHFRDAVIIGLASVLPFLVYYVVRKSTGVSRYTVKGFEYFLTESWFAEMGNRLWFHFGATGLILLFLILLMWCWVFIAPQWKHFRWVMVCILAALVSQIFLFNWDAGGISFTGYLRFYLLAVILFFAPVILVFSHVYSHSTSKKIVIIVASLFALLNTPKLYSTVVSFAEPDSVRSFNEHYDAPIYLPIRSLIETAEQAKAFDDNGNKVIHINHVTDWNQPAVVYPDLLKKYKLRVSKDLKCNCVSETPSVLAPFVYMSGLNANLDQQSIAQIAQIPQHQAKYVKRWRQVNEMRSSCLAQLKNSCQFYHEAVTSTGEVVGAIGVGAK